MINIFFEGMKVTKLTQFNSNNTQLMNLKEVKDKLMNVKMIREELEKWVKI